ncbi:AAA family ATPase [Bradyrhizobium sp. 215_C5_N1_1]|uniref:AAA family ATPase n=1 Tax=unclassified Bradyrhizobium TaxID=2631580 RepID=UPI003F89E712
MSLLEIDETERLSAPLGIEAFRDLTEWWCGGKHEPEMSPPLALGWDIHRQWPNAEGFAIWRDLMHEYEPPLLASNLLGSGDPRQAVTMEQYEAALVEEWARYARPKPILNDLAAKVGAKRAVDQVERDAHEASRLKWLDRFFELDDAGYAKWLADGRPDGNGLKFERWQERRFRELLEKTKAMPVVPFPSAPRAEPLPNLLQASGDFVRGFVPPDYLVDGVLQRRFCYSLTAQTGVGKTTVALLLAALVATGRPLQGLDVAKGTVLYFAGENPTDIQMRWLGQTRELGIDPAAADVHFVAGAMPLSSIAERITTEVQAKGLELSLVIVDTAAAYFEGDNENDNAQAVDHARRIRSLTALPGGPTVIVLCHPTKRAGDDDLIPRGGGAFLAEVDGNIALQKRESLVVASTQGKFRGREFLPLSFELKTVHHPMLKDVRGRDIPTVIAQPIDETGKQQMAAANRRAEDDLLKVIFEHPGASLRALAVALRWLDSKGQPNPMKVSRAADVLAREKLIQKHRNAWQVTSKGEIELNKIERPTNFTHPLNPTVTGVVTGNGQFPPIPER